MCVFVCVCGCVDRYVWACVGREREREREKKKELYMFVASL